MQLQKKSREGADGQRAKGAVTSESPPPQRHHHSSLFGFHYVHCVHISIIAEGYTDWQNHTRSFPHRYTRREDETSRGPTASFEDRATIGSCVCCGEGVTRADRKRGALAAAAASRHRSR